jgi:SAM-dependent methyltransferase
VPATRAYLNQLDQPSGLPWATDSAIPGAVGTLSADSRQVIALMLLGVFTRLVAGTWWVLPPKYRLPAGATILDIGCGVGFMLLTLAALCPQASVVGADLWKMFLYSGVSNITRAIQHVRSKGSSFPAHSVTIGWLDLSYCTSFDPAFAAFCYCGSKELGLVCAQVLAFTSTLRVLVLTVTYRENVDHILKYCMPEEVVQLQSATSAGSKEVRSYDTFVVLCTDELKKRVGDGLRAGPDPPLTMPSQTTTLQEELCSQRFLRFEL